MAAPAQHLAPIPDRQTGELQPATPEGLAQENQALRDELAGAMRSLRAESRRLEELKRDHQAEAEEHKLWPQATNLFAHWQKACRHPGADWKWERFELVVPYLKRRKYGLELCLRAIAGAAFDPFVTKAKNGNPIRHDGWDLIFRNSEKFESFCNRAPVPWECPDLAPFMRPGPVLVVVGG
jgi:hypothetical protein